MANKKAPIDFQALLDEVNADFPVYQALDCFNRRMKRFSYR